MAHIDNADPFIDAAVVYGHDVATTESEYAVDAHVLESACDEFSTVARAHRIIVGLFVVYAMIADVSAF